MPVVPIQNVLYSCSVSIWSARCRIVAPLHTRGLVPQHVLLSYLSCAPKGITAFRVKGPPLLQRPGIDGSFFPSRALYAHQQKTTTAPVVFTTDGSRIWSRHSCLLIWIRIKQGRQECLPHTGRNQRHFRCCWDMAARNKNLTMNPCGLWTMPTLFVFCRW